MNTEKIAILDHEEAQERDIPEFLFRGFTGRDSHCRLQIRWKGDAALICWTELASNPGMSTTNAAENLAARIVNEFNLDPTKCIFIEHYEQERGIAKESWCQVHFGRWEKRGDIMIPLEGARFESLDDYDKTLLMGCFKGGTGAA